MTPRCFPRRRFALPASAARPTVPAILTGPLRQRARFALPPLALVAGVAFLSSARPTQAANAADPVLAGATDLGVNTAGTTYTTTATTTSDVEFLAATTYTNAGTLGLSAALSIGTLDDFNATAIAINGTGLLTLNTAANSVAPNAADLLDVANGASLSIQTTGGITFLPTGNVDDAGTLSLGTSPVTITAGTTLSFLGAGATTVGGNIAATTGAVAINNAGGSVTFSGTNAYTGTTTIYNGALLSADATSAIGTGAVTLNPGATLRTLSTSGGSLGGGAFTLNTGTIQVGSTTVAGASATLPGALALTGGTSYINLQDGGTTASLKFTSTTTTTRSNAAPTVIVNGATALNGTTDVLNFGSTAGANAAAPNVITNGIFPGYLVGTTANNSTSVGFLTTTTGTVGSNNNVTLYTGYSTPAAGALTVAGTGIYDLAANSTYTNGTAAQTAYGLRFGGATGTGGTILSLGANSFNVGGGNSSTGTIIFNGTGDAITSTGGVLNSGGSGNGELVVYTGGSATIGASISSTSGGPSLTTFGPGTLTLTGASLSNLTQNGGQGITINGGVGGTGNVIANVGSIVINQVTVNGGAFTLGTANVFTTLAGTPATALTVNTLGTLDLHGNNEIVANLSGGSSALIPGGTITNSTGSAVLSLNNSNATYYGAISSSGLGLTKYGANTETLAGSLSYGGATTVNGGQLAFAPAVAGVNDNLGVLTLGQGLGTVQSTYQGTGTTTLTFSNLTARTAGAEGNFVSSGGTNGTTNKIVLTSFNGATPTAGALLDRGYFFGGSAYATVDAGGFLRAYTATDTNGANAASGTSNILNNPASNVFLTGSQSAQGTASVNTLNVGTGGLSVTLAAGATLSANGLLSNGIETISGGTGSGLKTTTAGGELVVRSNNNQLTLGTSVLDNGGTALTTSGSILLQATNTYTGVTTIDGGTVFVGAQSGTGLATGDLGNSSGVVLNSGGNVTFDRSNAYSFTNPITAGSLASGTTVTQAGAGALTLGNITNSVGNSNTIGITRNVSTGAFNLGTITGIGTLADNSTTGATAPTSITQTGTGLTIATINGASGSVVNLGGTGTTAIANVLNTVGQTVSFNGGTINLNGSGAFQSTMLVNGATVNTVSNTGNGSNFYQLLNLQVQSGTLNVQQLNGLRYGNQAGTSSTNGASSTVGALSGGAINFTNGASLQLGNSATTGTLTDTFAMSGGTFNSAASTGGISVGAGTTGGNVASFNFSGGTLLEAGTISGSQGMGAEQSFVWTGGTLATLAYNATNLTSTQGTAVSATTNTLTNAGGTLAPGGVGTVGLTTITGNYAVSSTATNAANAAYSVDLGTAAAATLFQNGTTGYDLTNVTLTAVLGGKLNVNLVGGFATTPPTSGATFTILQTGTGTKTAGSLSGVFTNTQTSFSGSGTVTNGLPVVVVGSSGLNSMTVTYNAGSTTAFGSVVLGNYNAGNTYVGLSKSAWDAAGAANWSVFDPGSTSAPATVASGALAQFGDGTASIKNTGSGPIAVPLNSTRNVQGVQFNSAMSGHNYTLQDGGGGTGMIVLDNTGNNAPATISDVSATGNVNTITLPIALNSALVATQVAGNTVNLNGAISGGAGLSVTQSGPGTLVLGGANTYTGATNVTAGTMLVNGSIGSTAAPASIVTVSNGGTLGGTGMLTVSSAVVTGTLTPGANSTGTLTLNTTTGLTINGGTLSLALGSTGTNGTILNTLGLSLSGATLVLSGTPNGVTNYDLVNYTGTLGGSGQFANLTVPAGYTINYAGTNFVTSGDDIELDVTPIPEPSAGLFVVLATAAGGLFWRRCRAQNH